MNTPDQSPHADDTYLNLMRQILETGIDGTDRTGTGTRALFGTQMRFPLHEGLPILTTKKLYLRGVITELVWFIRGDTNIRYLLQNKCHIWTEWAFVGYLDSIGKLDEIKPKTPEWSSAMEEFESQVLGDESFAEAHGSLGPIYGAQWRQWRSPGGERIDQLSAALESIRKKSDSRRIIVSAWNPAELRYMALEPCHCLFQFKVLGGKLYCQLYQRSCDFFLGVPFNIASYAILMHLIARDCDIPLGDFIWTGGDTHLYSNHFDKAELQLSRQGEKYPMPRLEFTPDAPKSIFEIRPEHIEVAGYLWHPAIRADIAV